MSWIDGSADQLNRGFFIIPIRQSPLFLHIFPQHARTYLGAVNVTGGIRGYTFGGGGAGIVLIGFRIRYEAGDPTAFGAADPDTALPAGIPSPGRVRL